MRLTQCCIGDYHGMGGAAVMGNTSTKLKVGSNLGGPKRLRRVGRNSWTMNERKMCECFLVPLVFLNQKSAYRANHCCNHRRSRNRRRDHGGNSAQSSR